MNKTSFKDFKLSEELLKSVDLLNYTNPTKVQERVIPAILDSKDLIVKSQTGSGKTAAFGIPICELVEWEENKPQALILSPTRELAIQVKEDIFNVGRFKRLKVVAIYGKSPIVNQEKELKQKTHIVVGTPGRVIDHIERGTLDLSAIKYVVIDEADEMLNMGFIEQIETVINSIKQSHMTMLFSATMPDDIEDLCDKYMNDPIFIEIEDQDKAIDRIIQERYDVEVSDKIGLLKDISIVENPDSCIIFCNTKIMVDKVYNELYRLKYSCEKIHGGMLQQDRIKVMNDFKLGKFRYLVATDVAARGIDIDNISLVINYDVPQERESYVHRIGRTGRIGKMGKAITLVAPYENKFVREIEGFIEKEIPLIDIPDKKTVMESRDEFYEKIKTKPDIKEIKGSELSKEIMKLHINSGKKAKMRPSDIVGTICSIEGLTKDDIGIINVLDNFSFVEILNNKGEMVYKALQTKPIKGILRKVGKSND